MRWFRSSAVALAALLTAAAPGVSRAEIHPIVVGVNKYRALADLKGAVADASDIAAALSDFTGRPVTPILNDAATRQSVLAAWERALARARKGDVIVFAIAGHGGQEPDLNGDEEDDLASGAGAKALDEVFLLGGFDPNDPARSKERIIDDELDALFRRAAQKGVGVVFVADVCFSGDLTRAPAALSRGRRSSEKYELPAASIFAAQTVEAPAAARLPATLTSFTASSEVAGSLEVPIDGKIRGPLSYAFARALEGAADRNRDGKLTRAELQTYVLPYSRQFETQNQPKMAPNRDLGKVVLQRGGASAAAPAPSSAPDPMTRRPVALFVEGGDVASTPGARLVTRQADAELIYDRAKRKIFNRSGDLLAEDVTDAVLPGIVAKAQALQLLQQAGKRAPFEIFAEPKDKLLRRGASVHIEIGPRRWRYLLAFNIASDGRVQRITEKPLPSLDRGFRTPLLTAFVTEPFGADHLVVLSSKTDIRGQIAQIEGMSSRDLLVWLEALLKDPNISAANLPLFTAEAVR